MADNQSEHFTELIVRQQRMIATIDEIRSGLVKIAKDRRTPEAFEEGWREIQRLFRGFVENHDRLVASGLHQDSQYFVLNKYDVAVTAFNRAGELMKKNFPDLLANDELPPRPRQVTVEIIDKQVQQEMFVSEIIPPEQPQADLGAIPKPQRRVTPPQEVAHLNVGNRSRSASPSAEAWANDQGDRYENFNSDGNLSSGQADRGRPTLPGWNPTTRSRSSDINGEVRWTDNVNLQASQRPRSSTIGARGSTETPTRTFSTKRPQSPSFGARGSSETLTHTAGAVDLSRPQKVRFSDDENTYTSSNNTERHEDVPQRRVSENSLLHLDENISRRREDPYKPPERPESRHMADYERGRPHGQSAYPESRQADDYERGRPHGQSAYPESRQADEYERGRPHGQSAYPESRQADDYERGRPHGQYAYPESRQEASYNRDRSHGSANYPEIRPETLYNREKHSRPSYEANRAELRHIDAMSHSNEGNAPRTSKARGTHVSHNLVDRRRGGEAYLRDVNIGDGDYGQADPRQGNRPPYEPRAFYDQHQRGYDHQQRMEYPPMYADPRMAYDPAYATPMWNMGRRYRPHPPVPEIPTFSGDIGQFEAFTNMFNSVYNGSDIGEAERLMMLQSKLKGDAKRVIEHLGVHAENYNHAWDLLYRRFNSRRALIEKEIQTIIDLPDITSKDSATVGKALDTMRSVIQNGRKVGFNAEEGFPFLPFIITRKMDAITRREFDTLLRDARQPITIAQLEDFLDHRFVVLTPSTATEGLAALKSSRKQQQNHDNSKSSGGGGNGSKKQPSFSNHTEGEKPREYKCFVCKEAHMTVKCQQLIDSKDKEALLRTHKVCIYCVAHKFDYKNPCRKRDHLNCEICHEKHIALMHPAKAETVANHCDTPDHANEQAVILPTAIVKLQGKDGSSTPVRCLIDQGAQSSYISEDLVQTLRLKRRRTNVVVFGVGGSRSDQVTAVVKLRLLTNDKDFPLVETTALVVKRVTKSLPHAPKSIKDLAAGKKLADPSPSKPAFVPLLLGSNVTPLIFKEGLEQINNYLFQNTVFDWVISGPAGQSVEKYTSAHVSLTELEQQYETSLVKFWDMPVTRQDIEAIEDEVCEKLFQEKHFRTTDGQYVVPTPFKSDAAKLGDSYTKAIQQFIGQERRWSKNETLKEKSHDFLREYLALGHMVRVPKQLQGDVSGNVSYIPYLSVLRDNAITTKLRIVFNAASKSSTGVSLNQTIHAGPKLQTHIFDLISCVRKFKFIFTSDVEKMFRAILLRDEDSEKLRIIWRENPTDSLEEYQLKTITYGMDCAPWQAIRTLRQCADDNAPDQETANVIKNGVYMDDLVYGANTVEAARTLVDKINETLAKGHMTLTKWTSNNSEILSNIPESRRLASYVDLQKAEDNMKTLGLHYNPRDDCFFFSIKPREKIIFTKRGLLSITASIYDSQGFLLPTIIKLRMAIQSLWQQGLDWDEPVGEENRATFAECVTTLDQLNQIRIPRWTGAVDGQMTEFVGFSDASGDGFAAVIYTRVKSESGYIVRLIASRGRVTPLKSKANIDSKLTTIPKLELESIVLLTELYEDVKKAFGEVQSTFTAYTDSEICLCWIRSQKEIENKFVKRRVTKIRKTLKPFDINHVRSADNPADCASRGLTPKELVNHPLWFTGAPFMQGDLPRTPIREQPEETTCNLAVADIFEKPNVDFIERFSSWDRLVDAIACINRWLQKGPTIKRPKARKNYSAEEITRAERTIILVQQKFLFSKQMSLVAQGKPVHKTHTLSTLSPFLDPDSGLLRAGGRLENANLPFDQKHPIILGKSHLTELLVKKLHDQRHMPAASLLSNIRSLYHIPAVQSQVKKVIRACVTCTRVRGVSIQPEMAALIKERVNPSFTFENVGTDLAGPFDIKSSPLRNAKAVKVYIAVFVCMSTKLIHLEIVSDLTANAYLSAFTRFTSRRGMPSLVRSDNGTNLKASAKVLNEAWEKLSEDVQATLAKSKIQWLFNPPQAPHFGGLFESAVKSFKYFVKRMPPTANLTYEEFHTITCSCEAILNSRPIAPMTDEAEDLRVLTPGHFAVQRHLMIPPMGRGYNDNTPISRRFLQVKEIQNQFWTKFETDYLCQLQKRYKWKRPGRQLAIGDLVIIRDSTDSPLTWKMGRVSKTLPDKKGIVRTVELKTEKKNNVLKAVHQLVALLPEDTERIASSPPQREKKDDDEAQTDVESEDEQPKRKRKGKKDDSKTIPSDVADLPQRKHNTRSSRCVVGSYFAKLFFLLFCIFGTFGASVAAESNSRIIPITNTTIWQLRDVQVVASHLTFDYETSENLTQEFEEINLRVRSLEDFCLQQAGESAKIKAHCLAIVQRITIEASMVKSTVAATYEALRPKRSIPWMLYVAGGRVLSMGTKNVGSIMTSGGMAYLAYDSFKDKQQLAEVEGRLAKTTQLLAQVSELEQQAREAQVAKLYQQQKEMLIEQQINEHELNVKLICSVTSHRHSHVKSLRPIEALRNFMNSNPTRNVLPKTINADSLFELFPITTKVEAEKSFVTFIIPLVFPEMFKEAVVIAGPDAEGTADTLDNYNSFQIIATNGNFSFFPNGAKEILPNVFTDVLMSSKNSCTSSLANNKNPQAICQRTAFKAKNGIFSLGRAHMSIFINDKTESATQRIVCNQEIEKVRSQLSLITDTRGCTFNDNDAEAINPEELHVTAIAIEKPLNSSVIDGGLIDDIHLDMPNSFEDQLHEIQKKAKENIKAPTLMKPWQLVSLCSGLVITAVAIIAISKAIIKAACKRRRERAMSLTTLDRSIGTWAVEMNSAPSTQQTSFN